jgi:hypothetical protein
MKNYKWATQAKERPNHSCLFKKYESSVADSDSINPNLDQVFCFMQNPDLDPDSGPGIFCQKLEILKTKIPSFRRRLHPSRENIQFIFSSCSGSAILLCGSVSSPNPDPKHNEEI